MEEEIKEILYQRNFTFFNKLKYKLNTDGKKRIDKLLTHINDLVFIKYARFFLNDYKNLIEHHDYEIIEKLCYYIDSDFCNTLRHEILRCEEALSECAECIMVGAKNGFSNRLSCKMFNKYSYFIFHLYEFYVGAYTRDVYNNGLFLISDNIPEHQKIELYITSNINRILKKRINSIENGTAPEWENHISTYQVTIPKDFAYDFRNYRNIIVGHADYRRSGALNLLWFFNTYHNFLYLLYYDAFLHWGISDEPLKEISDFCFGILNSKDILQRW